MKPSQFIESGLPGKRIVRRFPFTDWNYRAVGFPNFKSRCAGTPRSSFAEISRDYFNSEARRGFVFESVLFALISATVVPAILDCGRALLEFTHAMSVL
jgi:hypothetical protein